MLKNKQEAANDIDKAGDDLYEAKKFKEECRYSDSVQKAQVCTEFSVKAILKLLEFEVPRQHCFKKLGDITEDIQNRHVIESLKDQGMNDINLPRLLVLFDLWGGIYTLSKYGIECQDGNSKYLFRESEASLAIEHAEECYNAASKLLALDDCKILSIVTQGRSRKEDPPGLDYLIVWNDRRYGIGPKPPADAKEVEGEIWVETLSYDETQNTLGFWTEHGCFGTVQIHKPLRGSALTRWSIPSFSGRWWVKNMTMREFNVIRDK